MRSITSTTSDAFTGIPDVKHVKLKYTTFLLMTGTPTSTWKFRGNSIHDPDFTGVGGQPLGHDQWNNFYEKYMVKSSSIDVQILNNATTAGPGNVLINLLPQDSNVTRNYQELSDSQYNKNRFVAPVSAGQNGIFMKHFISTKKIMGDNVLDDLYEADFGSNPSEQWYWTLQADNFNQFSQHSLDVKVTITYYVKLFQRVELLNS
jgi:hypothetical protein